jgi:superfamily II DNA/RNA helicase
VVVVAPTHELAIQIQRVAMQLVQDAGWSLRTLLLVGGTSLDRQLEKLKAKPHLVVGTPGRLVDLLRMRKLRLDRQRALVVDEADLLLSGEANAAIAELVRAAPDGAQRLFVSATMRPEARRAAASLAPAAQDIAVAAAPVNADLAHLWLGCERRDKPDVLRRLWHALDPERALVFVHQDDRAEEIAAKLEFHHVPVADLHGAFRKEERKEAMEEFRSGRARVLIASDLAARGLDLPGVSHVINLDVPTDPQSYLHRTGRTARAGRKGTAITLMTPQEERMIPRYEQQLAIRLRRVWLRDGKVAEDTTPR